MSADDGGMHPQTLISAAVAAFQKGDLGRARQLAEQQLAKSEQSPLLHHLVGLIDCRLGQLDSGIERLKRAIAGDPTNLSYRMVLARALIDGGRAAEALDVARPTAGTTSAEIELWQVRAEAAFHAGRRAIEAEAWRAMCDARPQDAMPWANLGRSLLALYRFPEGEAAYRRAFALAPLLSLRHELGLLLERSNQLDELARLLDQALADGVPKEQLADLWALRALRGGDVEEAMRLADAIDVRPDPFRLYALKAKIADAADRPAEAFAAATAMNGSIENPAIWRARGRKYRAELRARERAMAAWLPELPGLPQSGRRSPAFLVGFPRSGTTLTEMFLRGHPDVRVLEEVPLLEAAAKWLGGVARLNMATPEQLGTARDRYFAALDEHIDPGFGGLVVDKQAFNMLSLPLIASLFPDARIIFAQRHPCDCVLSGFMQGFVPNNAMASFLDLADAADLYDAALSVFSRASDQLDLAVHRLVYEELISDPEEVLRPLTDFLGLEWHPELLDHRATAARRSAIKTPSYASVSQPLSKQPCGRWRRYETQLAPALPVLLPWAERLGYGD
jgi:tetratricopeptide (TPR) repeat protein